MGTNLRQKILHEIYNLEDTHYSISPLNNLPLNCSGEQEQQLNSLSKKGTFNKVQERYMENPFKYLQ